MTQEEKSERIAEAIIAPFPTDGITDEQIIWQVVKRGLFEEVAHLTSDKILIETWWERNREEIETRRDITQLLLKTIRL